MPRAASTLDLFACALVCALGCGPSAPPNAPPPAGNTPSSVALDAPPPPPSLIDDCAAGKLDDAATAMLVQRLEATHELKGERCFVRALQDYRPDVTEETVALAAQAVGDLKLKAASGPLFEVFTKIRASKPQAATTKAYRNVAEAMVAVLDPSWEPRLIALLSRPVDPKAPAALADEMYWQITAAKLLGLMKSENAIKPLIKVVLSPAKAAAHLTSILALVKIGKSAMGPSIALLKGDDKELVEYSRAEQLKAAAGDKRAEQAAATAYIGVAALILSSIGREEAATPLLEAIGKASDSSRALIARELPKVPKSAATMKAFQDAFEKTPVTLSLPGAGQGAREALLEAAGSFYDSSLVPFIAKQARAMKGEAEDLAPIQEASLIVMLKLATQDQLKLVDELARAKVVIDGKASTIGKGFEAEIKLTKDTLAACGNKVDCYLGKMTDPSSQKEGTQFIAIKSAYMIGVFGSAADKPKILAAMPKLTNPAARFLAVSLIDFLSPRGDQAMADALQQIVLEASLSGDRDAMARSAPFPTVIYRLHTRAQ